MHWEWSCLLGEKTVFGPLPCSAGNSIAVDHSVWLVHKPHVCVVVFTTRGLIAWPDSSVKFPSTGGVCMFVRTYTSRLSFQRTALRVPLTHVAMSPLFIFRDLGPISRGIPRLSWWTVPTRKGYFPYKLPLNLCNIYQFATDIVTTNTTMRINTCSFDNKRKKNVNCSL